MREKTVCIYQFAGPLVKGCPRECSFPCIFVQVLEGLSRLCGRRSEGPPEAPRAEMRGAAKARCLGATPAAGWLLQRGLDKKCPAGT